MEVSGSNLVGVCEGDTRVEKSGLWAPPRDAGAAELTREWTEESGSGG